MKLVRIKIRNFRSIKDATVELNKNCIILLGKNEVGKSNILKAIAAVFGEYKVSAKDKRKRIDNEKIEIYSVKGVVELSSSDIEDVYKEFTSTYQECKLISFTNGASLKDYIKQHFCSFSIGVDIKDNAVLTKYYRINHPDFQLASDIYLSNSTFSDVGGNQKLSMDGLRKLIYSIVGKMYDADPYKCHFWHYQANYLLPNRVDVASFIDDPSLYKGLQNIFTLCNRENIAQEFSNAKAEDGDYFNLCEQVSKETTKIFQKIWKDFKDTSIDIYPTTVDLVIKVVNKAKYSFEDRSDGFKKFISILLMLSSQSRANKIGERDIILIDEPDQSLYPTSARYLRDELLRMSEKSIIVYSTHSQYMIDSDCIERHLIVEKKDDVTSVRIENNNAPFSNDELLRNAIGTSIFECLQSKNIIFEGWLDKELFNKYCAFAKRTNSFKNYGKVYLGGISGVETLVQVLMLAQKQFVIVADSDSTSGKKKEEFVKNYKEYESCWVGYADVIERVSTMEDFLNPDYIDSIIKNNGYLQFVYDKNKNAISNIEAAVGRDNKEEKQKIKRLLIDNLTKENIKDDYKSYVDRLLEVLARN